MSASLAGRPARCRSAAPGYEAWWSAGPPCRWPEEGGRGRGVTAGRAGGPRWNRGANAPTRTGLPLRHPRGRTRVCRWHGAPLVDCSDGARTLHGVWTAPEAQRAADIKVPILMHHQFTADPDGVPTWLRDNYLYIGDFEQQIAYISDDHHHLLTWDELAAFVSGRLALPTGAVAHAWTTGSRPAGSPCCLGDHGPGPGDVPGRSRVTCPGDGGSSPGREGAPRHAVAGLLQADAVSARRRRGMRADRDSPAGARRPATDGRRAGRPDHLVKSVMTVTPLTLNVSMSWYTSTMPLRFVSAVTRSPGRSLPVATWLSRAGNSARGMPNEPR